VPNDGPIGDLQGDGEYEIGLRQAGRGPDNVDNGTPSERIPERYELDGALFWMIKPGRGVGPFSWQVLFIWPDKPGDNGEV
jgi:rhamnogalacturonan endolyase